MSTIADPGARARRESGAAAGRPRNGRSAGAERGTNPPGLLGVERLIVIVSLMRPPEGLTVELSNPPEALRPIFLRAASAAADRRGGAIRPELLVLDPRQAR